MAKAQSAKNSDDHSTMVEHSFEALLHHLFGKQRCGIRTGETSLPLLKQSLQRIFKNLAQASVRNINGDEAHRGKIIAVCRTAEEEIGGAKTKDAVTQHALTCAVGINFLLLGRCPDNFFKEKAGFDSVTDLSAFRTLAYVRTPKQQLAEIIHYAGQPRVQYEGSLFSRIMTIRQKHPKDDLRVLDWIRKNEPDLYARFNKA